MASGENTQISTPPPDFISGWAGGPALFPALASKVRFWQPFAPTTEMDIVSKLCSGGQLLLAWSTGAHMVLKHHRALFPHYRHIVLIAPFLRFTDGLPQHIVQRMQKGITTNATATLAQFYRNCGISRTAELMRQGAATDPVSLHKGLAYLLESKAQVNAPGPHDHICLVFPDKDRIVPARAAEHVRRALPHAAVRHSDSGHFLPETAINALVHEISGSSLL